jgi:tetratricopeptide (TPR) repeat protein
LEEWERRSAQAAGSPAVSIPTTLLARAGEVDRAVAALGEALEHAPDNAGLLNARCWTRAIANIELDEALADCERAVELQPGAAAYIDSRAMVRLRLGQYDKAIEDATAALAIAPRLSASLFVRGVARIRHGDTGGGEADLAAARRIEFDIDSEYREYGVTP